MHDHAVAMGKCFDLGHGGFAVGASSPASDRGIFRDIIIDGVNGVLMDIDQPGFLDRALRAMDNANLQSIV